MAKKSTMQAANSEPQWKTVERVVALLEQSLSPGARVRHNVKLPCLTTGHEEQCDVVIETGDPPRITRTIVEVQMRNSQVMPNDFRGWCVKMRDVGAHRLICVSARPFPKSIKDKVAKELGPVVLLVRLQDLETSQWPFQIVNNAMRVYKATVNVDVTIKPNPVFIFPPDQNPFQSLIGPGFNGSTKDRLIRREGQADLLPIIDVINEGIKKLNDCPEMLRLPEGNYKVPHRWCPKGLSLCLNDVTAPIQALAVTYSVEIRCVYFPFEISSYTQAGHPSSLAWVVRATGKLDGEDAEIRFTLMPDANGSFRMGHAQLFGIKEGVFMFWGHVNNPPTSAQG